MPSCVRHFYVPAKRITVRGGNQARVKVAHVVFDLFSQMVISQLLVNKIEWNKFHFVANVIAFKMNTNLMKIPLSCFFWHSLYFITLPSDSAVAASYSKRGAKNTEYNYVNTLCMPLLRAYGTSGGCHMGYSLDNITKWQKQQQQSASATIKFGRIGASCPQLIWPNAEWWI